MSPELADLLAQAKTRVEAMTPEEREKMWADQRASWVRGEMALGLDRSEIRDHLLADSLAPSEGAFRMGARAMREVAKMAARDAMVDHEWPPTDGDRQIDEVLARIDDQPLPPMPEREPAPEAAWAWWAGSNDEYYTSGPFGSRGEAVEALDGEDGYIIEAIRHEIHFNAARLIECDYFENEDLFSGEHSEADRKGGGDVIAAADAELQAMLDAWVGRWRYTFVQPEMFAATRNRERIEADPAIEWKGRFVRRWLQLTGTLEGATDEANAAWEARDVNDPNASPEECAEAEVSYAREDAR